MEHVDGSSSRINLIYKKNKFSHGIRVKGNEGKGNESAQQAYEDLTRLVHKLAGTAAIFDEPELGDQAVALEHALRMPLVGEVRAALALELLSVAEAHETQEHSAPD